MELKTTATNDDKGKNKEATLLTTLGWGTERKRESKSHRLKLGGWKRVNCEQGGRVWKMIHAMARSMGNVEVWDSCSKAIEDRDMVSEQPHKVCSLLLFWSLVDEIPCARE